MTSLFLTALVEPAALSSPCTQPQIDLSSAASLQRAGSSPHRKHKRKAAQPHRSALDTGTGGEEPSPEPSESRPKERRGSASPPAVSQQSTRSTRLQRAASSQLVVESLPSAGSVSAPLPEELAAVFDQITAAQPVITAMATADAAKFCVQCGTTVTPMWRSVNGLTYCNADGLRLKRRLGLL